jgi:hypothetical protein
MAEAKAPPAADGHFMTLQREGDLVLVRLRGEIDDRQSEAWRARVDEEIRIRGVPRFVAFDMFDSNPRSSMTSRFQVASYVRAMMKRVEWAALLMPRNVGATVVVRLVMKMWGVPTVSVASSLAEFERILDKMLRGERP